MNTQPDGVSAMIAEVGAWQPIETAPTRAQVAALMKRCQTGVGGRCALDDAHNILAECYGTLGRQQIELERLRAALEVSEAATAGAIRAAQWQARTNAELNKLQDEVRKLRGEACRRLNDEFGA